MANWTPSLLKRSMSVGVNNWEVTNMSQCPSYIGNSCEWYHTICPPWLHSKSVHSNRSLGDQAAALQALREIQGVEGFHCWAHQGTLGFEVGCKLTCTPSTGEPYLGSWYDLCLFQILGQAGVPHPQAPNNQAARMFKVLKEVAEVTSSGTKGETEIKVGGRVRSAPMKEMVAKQLKTGFDSLEGQPMMDLKTGAIKSKKCKKERTAEQTASSDLKQFVSKLPSCKIIMLNQILFIWCFHSFRVDSIWHIHPIKGWRNASMACLSQLQRWKLWICEIPMSLSLAQIIVR